MIKLVADETRSIISGVEILNLK